MVKTCLMCGKPSGMYALCMDCIKLKNEGKIEKCPDCGKRHYKNKSCDCKGEKVEKEITKEKVVHKENNFVKKDIKTKGCCIICGKDAPNGPQCRDCYF